MENKKDMILNALFITMSVFVLLGFAITIGIRMKFTSIVDPNMAFLGTIFGDLVAASIGTYYLYNKNKWMTEAKKDVNSKWFKFEFIAIGLIILNIVLTLVLFSWLKHNDDLIVAATVSLVFVVLLNIIATAFHEYANWRIKIDLTKKEILEEDKEDSKTKTEQSIDVKASSEISKEATAGKFYE